MPAEDKTLAVMLLKVRIKEKNKATRQMLWVKWGDRLTYAEKLRVHTVEVGDEEKRIRSRNIKKQQVASGQIQNKTTSMHNQQIY